jgi:formate dehydrogenase subunit gamma
VMQVANLVHIVAAMFAIAISLFHIYVGTIGVTGAYAAMRTGFVDETWAKDHYGIWYEQVKSGEAPQRFADELPPPAGAQRSLR